MWRGGRAFKPAATAGNESRTTNGADNVVTVVDSDEESAADKYRDEPIFEDEKDDTDSTQPYTQILQTLDLSLGTAALHLATLPASFLKATQSLPKPYQIIRDRLVFAAACADNYVRLITLPLTPPSPESKARSEFQKHPFNANVGNNNWGESIIRLSGHIRPANGVSLTLNLRGSSKDLPGEETRSSTEPAFIVASHSKDITGSLLLFRILLGTHIAQIEPFQTIHLTSPASTISFNTSSSPSRTSHLLVGEIKGSCRIYDYSTLSRVNDEQSELACEQGTWLLSLYAGFQGRQQDSRSPSAFGRKTMLDAKWVLGGRAIVVLLDDGEWLVWDIEGAGPGASQGLLGRQGIVGGSKTTSALSGFLESRTLVRNGSNAPTSSKFAPMTPGTRKSAEPFGSSRSQVACGLGQISVSDIPAASSSGTPDESVAFWYGETYALIPSLLKYWLSHQTGSTNPFVGTGGGRIIKLAGIDLQGERCTRITQFPPSTNTSGSIQDLLIVGEHRFTIVSGGKVAKQPSFRGTGRLALNEKSSNGGGLEDIDRALALMDHDTKMELF